MLFFKQQSSSAQAALVYVTIGSLVLVWTLVWSVYLNNNPPDSKGIWYLCGGSFFTGLVLLVIGLGVGHIGRSARQADNLVQAHPDTTIATVATVPVTNGSVATASTLPSRVVAAAPQSVVTDTTSVLRTPAVAGSPNRL